MKDSGKIKLQAQLRKNHHTFVVVDTLGLIELWERKTNKTREQITGNNLQFIAPYLSPTLDTSQIAFIAKDIVANHAIKIKNLEGKQYFIFKIKSHIKNLVKSMKPRAPQLKIIDIGISRNNSIKSVHSGLRLTFITTVSANIFKYFIDDKNTLGNLIGTTVTDTVKMALSATASVAIITAFKTGGAAAIVSGPFAIAVIAGVLIGVALNQLDNYFGITDALAAAIDKQLAPIKDKIIRQTDHANKTLIYQLWNNPGDYARRILY